MTQYYSDYLKMNFGFLFSDSDLLFWLQGVNVTKKYDVEIDEIDVCPLQIQGPLSKILWQSWQVKN